MRVNDKSITAFQAGIMLFILLFANKILVLPALLYDGAKFNAIFIPICLFVLEFLLLWLFFVVKKKFPTQSLSEVISSNCGKIVKTSLYIFILMFFICKAVLLYNISYIFFRNMLYKDSSNFIFLFCFIPIINHMALCGLRVMGRTSQLFFPVIALITLFCIVVGFFGVNKCPLLFDGTFNGFIMTLLKHFSCFGDVMFLFLIMDKVEIKKGQSKIIFFFALASAIFVVTVITLFIFSYTYTSFMHPYAIFEIMSYVKEYGGVGRIDIISMVLIIIYAYFHLSIYLKAFMLCFQEIFPKISAVYSVITFDLIFLVVVNCFIINLETAVIYGENILPFFEIIPFVILPIILLISIFLNRRIRR